MSIQSPNPDNTNDLSDWAHHAIALGDSEKAQLQQQEALEEKCRARLAELSRVVEIASLPKVEQLLEKIQVLLEDLKLLGAEKRMKEELVSEKAIEWRLVGATLDKLFFFIYLTGILVLLLVSTAILVPKAF